MLIYFIKTGYIAKITTQAIHFQQYGKNPIFTQKDMHIVHFFGFVLSMDKEIPQPLGSPLPEFSSLLRIYSISYRNDHIQIVVVNISVY